MKLCSTYYDKALTLDKDAYTFVRVSCMEPPASFSEAIGDFADLSSEFGPTPAMLEECHPTKDWQAFVPRYQKEILGVLDKEATLALLEQIHAEHGGRPCVLTCFEPPPENCHRHLIGDFLGIRVEEL